MGTISVSDVRGFYNFCLLVFIAAFLNIWFSNHDSIMGFVTVFWGFIGFYRFAYLSDNKTLKIPKILTLPSRILFGLNQHKNQSTKNIINRFLKFDVLLLFIGIILLTIWGVYNSLHPLQINLFRDFMVAQDVMTDEIDSRYQVYYTLEKISFVVMVTLIMVVGISYAPLDRLIINARFIFIPVTIILLGIIMWQSPVPNILFYFDFSHLKGIGYGFYDAFEKLSDSNQNLKTKTGFVIRYVETGLIGAYGLYIIFMPVIYMTLQKLTQSLKRTCASFALVSLFILFASDFILPTHALTLPLQFITLAYLALALGRLGYDSQKS